MKRTLYIALAFGLILAFGDLAMSQGQNPLPSWNNGKAKQSIINFVAKVTQQGSPDFVPPAERIATFDNDGTLWAEQPMYFQFQFAFDRVKALAPEQVVGSSIKTRFEMRDDKPVLVRLPELNFMNDKDGKPIGIHTNIGRRPIAAFGNSDGDLQMLQWTTAGPGPRFALYVHHTDSEREWAYDRDSSIGRLDKGLNEAPDKGWTVVDMKQDWKVIYPHGKR